MLLFNPQVLGAHIDGLGVFIVLIVVEITVLRSKEDEQVGIEVVNGVCAVLCLSDFRSVLTNGGSDAHLTTQEADQRPTQVLSVAGAPTSVAVLAAAVGFNSDLTFDQLVKYISTQYTRHRASGDIERRRSPCSCQPAMHRWYSS